MVTNPIKKAKFENVCPSIVLLKYTIIPPLREYPSESELKVNKRRNVYMMYPKRTLYKDKTSNKKRLSCKDNMLIFSIQVPQSSSVFNENKLSGFSLNHFIVEVPCCVW